MENTLTAARIIQEIRQAFEPQDSVHALWQAGAAAFNRVDSWSDIDLMIVVDDDRVEDAFTLLEGALNALSTIELKFRIPQPTWHGHDQAIYRLKNASPFLLIDAAVMKASSKDKFIQPELHGQADVLFDKTGAVSPGPFDWDAHREILNRRLDTITLLFDLFQVLTLKEIKRGNGIEALAYYHSFTLRPLIELLRIRYTPAQYNFHTRYVYYDLPAEVVQRLEQLYFVGSLNELEERQAEANQWFWQEQASQKFPPTG
jgi:hypothetical protein